MSRNVPPALRDIPKDGCEEQSVFKAVNKKSGWRIGQIPVYLLHQKRFQFSQFVVPFQDLISTIFPMHRGRSDGTAHDFGLLQRFCDIWIKRRIRENKWLFAHKKNAHVTKVLLCNCLPNVSCRMLRIAKHGRWLRHAASNMILASFTNLQ